MFGHPYVPYDVQLEFMRAMYSELNNGTKINLFESPTGTGKTFSLLCPAVAWIRDSAKRRLAAKLSKIDNSGGPEWMRLKAKQLVLAQESEPKRPRNQLTSGPSQIVFASRTHSQLAQIAASLRKLKIEPQVSYVELGSRKHLCVNPKVSSLKNQQLINDRCAELLKTNSCAFAHNLEPLNAKISAEILDIEDLHKLGEEKQCCPYYATREFVKTAEVVAVPYAVLLVAKAREAVGLSLENAVVIIDEAHNLMESLQGLHSQTLNLKQLQRAKLGLKTYLSRVGVKLSPINRRFVMQIQLLVDSLLLYFQQLPKNAKPGTPVTDLLRNKNADTLNLPELANFTTETKLMFKVDSYTTTEFGANTSNCLGAIFDFVLTATDPLAVGKLYIDVLEGAVVLRYLVLDASQSFKEITEEAQSIILAGGTMEPTSEFKNHLFPYTSDVSVHTYGHIVPPKQLLVLPVTGMKFTFAERGGKNLILKLGDTIARIASLVPNGMVVFFQGYAYLEQVVKEWKLTEVWDLLNSIKPVLAESRGALGDSIFAKYQNLAPKKGAMLLAVVGGKLSEGINFSDELARAVLMVGIPYPNAFSAEMVAKRVHIESAAIRRGETPEQAKNEAREYYENLAMKQVNQSVGRAIRHINDYAALFLIDDRFNTEQIKLKLSKWVRENIKPGTNDNEVIKKLVTEFFKANKSNKELENSI